MHLFVDYVRVGCARFVEGTSLVQEGNEAIVTVQWTAPVASQGNSALSCWHQEGAGERRQVHVVVRIRRAVTHSYAPAPATRDVRRATCKGRKLSA